MTDLVVRAGTVITVDGERRVVDDGAVAIADGAITEVGSGAEVEARHPGAEVIAHPDGIVLPGLVDVHGHAGHSLVRTLGGDDLGAWLDACERIYLHGSDEEFWRVDATLTALERLMAGTTTGLSMFGGAGDTIRCDDPRYALAHVDGVRSVGIRDVLVLGPGAPPFPKRTTDLATGRTVASSFDDQMATLEAVHRAAHDGERTLVATTFPTLPASAVGSPDPELARLAETVADFGAEHDLLFVQDGHRGDTVLATELLGLLGRRALLSHAVDLGESEIDLVAARGAGIAHNPSAVFSQFGRCPVPELVAAGVTVALGSDATAPDRSADMFRHMFQATRYHRADRRDPALLPPGRVLEMATVDGARALGLGDRLGSLEPGKWADLVVVDGARPHLTPLVHPVHQVVYYAAGADVATVVVGGEVLMRDRVVAGVDVPAVLDEARGVHRAVLDRSGLEAFTADRPGTWGRIRYPDGPGFEA
jgi:cytosine/adenosine deaminase-related metal-dependent hydrolase